MDAGSLTSPTNPGYSELYVQSFNADGKLGADRKRLSANGANSPVWRSDGKEIFSSAATGK